MCDYELEPGKKCPLERHSVSPFCVLHTPFTEDKNSVEFQQLLELKNKKIKEKIEIGDFDFRGAIIQHFVLSDKTQIKGSILFTKTVIGGNASFFGATIKGDALFKKATIKGDVNFEGATIEGDTMFWGATIGGDAVFEGASICGDAWFRGVKIQGDALFKKATINGKATFWGATIKGNVKFEGATIGRDALFLGATIGGDAVFEGAMIEGDTGFRSAKIQGDALFNKATINGDTIFEGATIDGNFKLEGTTIEGDAIFKEDENKLGIIKGDIRFVSAKIIGELVFTDSFFKILHAREQINRCAKKLCEERGEKHDADKYFYKEMNERRKQKFWEETKGQSKKERLIKVIEYYLEWPLKNLFFYGVYPAYSFFIWIVIILVFAIIYNLFGMIVATSFWDYLYFSITNAMTPGYGGIDPNPGIPRLIASIEAVFGTFMWASFIAILARKFMR